MGVEIPVWVIQSPSGRRTLNRVTGRFQSEPTEECIFNTEEDAHEKIKIMDHGFTVRRKRQYRDMGKVRIW